MELINFKITQQGRSDSVVNTTMGRAIDIARERAANHKTTVSLLAECPEGSGRFVLLGKYMYCPDKDEERQILAVPVVPKHRVSLYHSDDDSENDIV